LFEGVPNFRYPRVRQKARLQDYDRLLRTGVAFEELVLWLGEPLPKQAGEGGIRAFLVLEGSTTRTPLRPAEARWDCMKFEPVYCEVNEARRNPELFSALFPESIHLGFLTLHILLQCHAARIDGDLWVAQHQCLKHAMERLAAGDLERES
jgi:hypothetical protein